MTVEQNGRKKLSTSFSANAWSGIIRDLIVVGKCIAESLSACPVTLDYTPLCPLAASVGGCIENKAMLRK
jgi:hypothetical protein